MFFNHCVFFFIYLKHVYGSWFKHVSGCFQPQTSLRIKKNRPIVWEAEECPLQLRIRFLTDLCVLAGGGPQINPRTDTLVILCNINFLFPEIWICKLPLFLCVSLYFRNCSEPLIPIHVFVVLDTFSKENIYFRTYIVKGEIILLFHFIKCLVDIQWSFTMWQ